MSVIALFFNIRDEEEAKKQAEIEKQRQETEARQKAKAEVKKNRQRIRAVCNDLVNNGTLKADDLQELCLGTPVEELDAIASDFERLVQEHDGLGKVVIKFTEIRQAIFQAKEIEEENHRKQQQKNKQQEVGFIYRRCCSNYDVFLLGAD